MTNCDLCQKPTDKTPEQRIGMSGDVEVPYTMPVYCDECLKDLEALEADMKDMEQIRREWQDYRNEGLGSAG